MLWIRKHARIASALALCLLLGATVTPAAASTPIGMLDAQTPATEAVLLSGAETRAEQEVVGILTTLAGAYAIGYAVGAVARHLTNMLGEPVVGTDLSASYNPSDFTAFDA